VRDELAEKANIPKRFAGVSVNAYEPRTEEQRAAKQQAVDYVVGLAENLKAGVGLTLWGPPGSGKTHLVVAVLMAALERKLSGYFVTEDGVFDRFRENWGEPAEEVKFLRLLQTVRFLVIDDMGIRKPTDYVSDRYEAIINTRYAEGLPTIVTTNRDPAQLAEVYPRQMSRLAANQVLHVYGPDARG